MRLCQGHSVFSERKIGEVDIVCLFSIPEGGYSTSIEGASEGAIGGCAIDQGHEVVHMTMWHVAQRHV